MCNSEVVKLTYNRCERKWTEEDGNSFRLVENMKEQSVFCIEENPLVYGKKWGLRTVMSDEYIAELIP